MKRRNLILAAAGTPAATLLGACGGGSDAEAARMRLLNASPGYAALDLYVDDARPFADVAYGSASAYAAFDADTYTVALRNAGAGANLQSASRTLRKDTRYSLVAYGWAGALQTLLLTEDEDAPASGTARLRVLNTAADAGSVDVYVGAAADTVEQMALLAAGVEAGASSDFSDLDSGSYRLVVTAAGDTADVRLDAPAVAVDSRQVATLVVLPTRGGVLVDALLAPQAAAVSLVVNSRARVRVAAAVGGNANVSVVAGGTTLTGGTRAPSVGAYTAVAAGTLALDVRVDGVAVSADALQATGGGDYTVLVHGTAEAPAVTVLSDDNRLPLSSANYKIRLVHAVAELAGGLSLEVDFTALASDVTYASASPYVARAAVNDAALRVATPSLTSPVFSLNDTDLLAKGVYTVFLFGTAAAPFGALRKDR
jgi:hypothetical protein